MKILRILAVGLLMGCFVATGADAQSSRRKGRTGSMRTQDAPASRTADVTPERKSGEMDDFLASLMKNAFVVLRQDYQLINEDGDIKDADGKDYWGRTYSMGARVGNSDFLISGDAVRPWAKDGLSLRDSYQPAISQSAVRGFEAVEFEPLDFDPGSVTELREKRLYVTSGSEEPGLSVVGPMGRMNGYAVWACVDHPVVDGDDCRAFNLKFVPMTVNFVDGKNIYDPSPAGREDAFGGFFLVPVKTRPGIVDFCVAGMFQRIGGIWKLVSVPEGTELSSTAYVSTFERAAWDLASAMEREVRAFVSEVGL